MYSKKIAFSFFTVPALGKNHSPLLTHILCIVLAHQGYEFQTRRKEDKENEAQRRSTLLAQAAVDITPQNKAGFPWSAPKVQVDEFENDFSFKKVKVRGVFDHSKEIQVEKMRNGEKGVEVITPFYTHLNE
jgi:cytochrome oxidase assembly protein ShyY1